MSGDYYTYLLEAVRTNALPLTSRCNVGCVFCSHRQNPADVTTYRVPALPLAKVKELAQFLDPGEKVVIGESATRLDEGEPLTHPGITAILNMLREMYPGTIFSITTNGTLLTADLVQALIPLSPLEFTISLNSATAMGRRLLMNDHDPKRARDAVKLLQKHRLPYHGSLVAMPHLVGWQDLDDTVTFLAEHGALTIRIFLPGYTKHAPNELRFPMQLWDEVTTRAREWTQNLNVPVIPEPYVPSTLEADIWGVIPGSPAQRAGLKPGDIILEINGKPVQTRVEAFTTAKRLRNPRCTLKRDERVLTVTIEKESKESPGFVAIYDFHHQRAAAIAAELRRAQAKAPLLLASELGYPLLLKVFQSYEIDVQAIAVPNQFFGGSIKAAGLLTVSDFLAAAKQAFKHKNYDLLLVPREAFDYRQQDLTGQHVDSLSHTLSIPVRII